jgi:hypothetical protein
VTSTIGIVRSSKFFSPATLGITSIMNTIFWIKLNPIINMETIGNIFKWRTQQPISVFTHHRKISLYRPKSIFPRSNRRSIYKHLIFESIEPLVTNIYDNSLVCLGCRNLWNNSSFWEISESILMFFHSLSDFPIIYNIVML